MKIIVSNSEMVFKINDGTLGAELCTINYQTPDTPVYTLNNNEWKTNSYSKWTKQDPIDIPLRVARVYGYTSYYKDGNILQVPGIIFMDNNNQIVGYSMSADAGLDTKSLPFDENIPVNATKMIIQAISDSAKLTVKFGV